MHKGINRYFPKGDKQMASGPLNKCLAEVNQSHPEGPLHTLCGDYKKTKYKITSAGEDVEKS